MTGQDAWGSQVARSPPDMLVRHIGQGGQCGTEPA